MSQANIHSLPLKSFPFIYSRPFLISGPCGVESENQIHEIASALKNVGINLLRGGIWKPRTRPDSFQAMYRERSWEWAYRRWYELPARMPLRLRQGPDRRDGFRECFLWSWQSCPDIVDSSQ